MTSIKIDVKNYKKVIKYCVRIWGLDLQHNFCHTFSIDCMNFQLFFAICGGFDFLYFFVQVTYEKVLVGVEWDLLFVGKRFKCLDDFRLFLKNYLQDKCQNQIFKGGTILLFLKILYFLEFLFKKFCVFKKWLGSLKVFYVCNVSVSCKIWWKYDENF